MSYDLAIWYSKTKPNVKAAQKFYEGLCDEEVEATANPAIATFISELTEKYPQIDDWDEDEIDDCPWTCEFDTSDGHCIVNINFDSVDEVAPFVIELAKKHGLICYDPQSEKLC